MELSSVSNLAMHCPSTPSTILERAISLGCNQIYQYHCLRNKEDEMVERCLEVSWIQKDKCAVYDADAQKIDEWKCFRNLGICPKRQYLSNDVMSYSACVPSLTPTTPADGKDNSNTVTSQSDGKPWIWALVAMAFLIVIVAIVSYFMIYKRRKRSFPDPKVRDEETAPLQSLIESREDPKKSKEAREGKDPRDSGSIGFDVITYYKTKTYEYLENRLINSAVSIIVIGEPGSGKSVLGKMLYTRFWKREINGKDHTARLLNLGRLKDTFLSDHNTHNTKTVNILDNCLEVWNHYPHLITPSFEQIQSFHEKVVKGEGSCLVIIISKMNFENNLDAAQRAQLTSTDQLEIVDLSSTDFQLDITDKIGILEYHRKKKGPTARRVDDAAVRKVRDSVANYVDKISKLEFEFPLSCHLYYKHYSFEGNQEIFFSLTREIIKGFVKGLSTGSHEEKCQYCTLMYVALCGGQIQTQKKQDDTLLKGIAEVSKIDTSELEFNYGCCLVTREEKKNTFEIIHEEISKFLFSMFGERYTGMVIDKCEVEVLMKFVRTEDKSRLDVYRRMGFLMITHNLYDRLAARLQGIYDIDQRHAIFRDPDFCVQFKKDESKTNAKKKMTIQNKMSNQLNSFVENMLSLICLMPIGKLN